MHTAIAILFLVSFALIPTTIVWSLASISAYGDISFMPRVLFTLFCACVLTIGILSVILGLSGGMEVGFILFVLIVLPIAIFSIYDY